VFYFCCIAFVFPAENASCGRRAPDSTDSDVVVGSPLTTAKTTSICAGCQGPIRDQFMLHVDPALDWHVSCLRCAECRQMLDESCTCFVRDGRTYCKPDYCRSASSLYTRSRQPQCMSFRETVRNNGNASWRGKRKLVSGCFPACVRGYQRLYTQNPTSIVHYGGGKWFALLSINAF